MAGKLTVPRVKYEIRRRIERWNDPDLRNARAVLRALRTSAPEVLYLGDSTASFVAPYDADRRDLATMVADALAGDVSVLSVNGGSYHADLLESLAGLVEPFTARPVMVVPLWVRGRYVPWIEHPVWGHKQAMARIRSIRPGTPWWRVRGGFANPAPEEFEAFHRLPYPTLLGDLTIGDYVRPLKDTTRWTGDPDARVRMLHGYHHGARLDLDSPALDAVRELGAVLARLGGPVVAYQTPVPVESGRAHLGPGFDELAAANFAVLDEAFRQGYGGDVEIIASGTIFPTAEFIDVAGADEHLNEAGRLRLSALIVDGVRRALAT